MSLGRPDIGRRSSPTICQSRSWCRRRATIRPRRPEIPVITTLRSRGSARSVTTAPPSISSPEDMLALAESLVDHRLDPALDDLDLLVEHLVVVIGIAGHRDRLAEVQPVLDRQRQE